MVESMRGETKAVSVSKVFPVHSKGWPRVGAADHGLGSPVAFPSHDEAKPMVLQEGTTAPWGNFGYDDLGYIYFFTVAMIPGCAPFPQLPTTCHHLLF